MARKNRNAGAAPLNSPQTREERYLANIAGLVNTKPEYPFTRTERYLDAISSGTTGLADRVTALETDKLNVIGKGINLLDNAYFIGGGTGYGVFPVNQRGNTQYSGTSPAQPAFDRWKVSFTTATLTANGVELVSTGGYGLLQYLSAGRWDLLVGKTVTLSALVTANSGDLKFYSGSTLQETRTGTGVLSATFVMPGGFQESSKFIGIQGNATISAVKLELGSQQTLARQVNGAWVLNDPPPDYGQELAKCQRYLQVITTTNSDGALIGSGYVNSGTNNKQILITVCLPVTMDSITSLQTSNVGAMVDGGFPALVSASIFAKAGNIITLSLISSSSIATAFAPATAYILNGGYIMLSAE